jgi:hypothetical protein
VLAALLVSGAASLALIILAVLGQLTGPWRILLLAGAASMLVVAAVGRWWTGRRSGAAAPRTGSVAGTRSGMDTGAPAGTPPPDSFAVQRRSFLGTGISVAAGALGAAAAATVSANDRAAAPGVDATGVEATGPAGSAKGAAQMIDIREFVGLVVDRPTTDDPDSWDWTPALRAAVQAAAERAGDVRRLPGEPAAFRRDRLPTVRLPQGRYRIRGPVDVRYLHGLTVRGDGPEATVLTHETGTTLFHVNRSHAVTFADLTVDGRESGVEGPVTGLLEGSCAFRLEEWSGDGKRAGGNTFAIRFDNVQVTQMHRAFHFVGDQMTDGVLWSNVWLRDNFIDFHYENSQAVNHQLVGGQVAYGVDHAHEVYQERLNRWKSPPDVRDGAMFRIRVGGQISMFGGVIIARKSTLLFDRPPQDASLGATVNVLPYLFVGTRWEMRERDPVGDAFGLQRNTVVRYAEPFAGPAVVRPAVRFVGCDWLVLPDQVDLLHLANAVSITADSCRVWPEGRGGLTSLLDAATTARPGTYRSVNSSLLSHARRGGPGGAPAPTTNHIVEMHDTPASAGRPGQQPLHRRTLVPGVPYSPRRVLYRGAAGELLAAGATRLQTTLLVPGEGNAVITRVGVAALTDTSGAPVTVTFAGNGSQLRYAELVVDSSGAGQFDGTELSKHSRPYAVVEDLSPGDGRISVTLTRQAAAGELRGYVYVDYA